MAGPVAATDVEALARRIATGELTASSVADDWLERLRRVDAVSNCVATWNDGGALARAAELDRVLARSGPVGPLHGVPFTVKDWIDVAGLPCTGGYVEARARIASNDATVVARMLDAGAIVLAKTTVQVETELFGAVRNPHDPSRSPGASSSGEAAAVGGGGSPLGLASDSGGSIRLPAAWCGAAALKPTAGRVPTTGHFPRVGERSDGRTQIGLMGACVRSVIAALSVIAGSDDRDSSVPPVAPIDAHAVRIEGLRIGFTCADESWTPEPAVREAVMRSVALLEARGAVVVGEVPQQLDEALDITRRYWKRKVDALPGDDAERHLVDWDRYCARMRKAFAGVDAVIMPASVSVAPLHQPIAETDFVMTLPASLTGAPAAVVPVGEARGLPVAVQVVARPWRDDVALRVALALEDAASVSSSG